VPLAARCKKRVIEVYRKVKSLDSNGQHPRPDGLFKRIKKEPEDSCLYKRLFLDYTYGLDRIYSREEVDKAKA
jgi:hypothetical protein